MKTNLKALFLAVLFSLSAAACSPIVAVDSSGDDIEQTGHMEKSRMEIDD